MGRGFRAGFVIEFVPGNICCGCKDPKWTQTSTRIGSSYGWDLATTTEALFNNYWRQVAGSMADYIRYGNYAVDFPGTLMSGYHQREWSQGFILTLSCDNQVRLKIPWSYTIKTDGNGSATVYLHLEWED